MADEVVVIEAGHTERHYWRDLWRYRELFYFLAWRDILVRYKQTAIGLAWAVLRPFLTMVVFTIVFGVLGKFPSGGTPYPVLVYAAMLPWQFFANSVSEAGGSLVSNSNLISKVYFPRIIVPASAVVTSLVDFLVAAVILAGLMAWYGIWPGWRAALLPFFLLLASISSIGAGLWLAALNVRYRDFRYVIPFFVQFGLYISPVGFSSSVVPERWRALFSINPVAGVIDGFRWALLGDTQPLYMPGIVASAIVGTALAVSGFLYFRSTERTFADVI